MGSYGSPELHPKLKKESSFNYKNKFIYCPKCGRHYSTELSECPDCGANVPFVPGISSANKSITKNLFVALLILTIIVFIMFCIFSEKASSLLIGISFLVSCALFLYYLLQYILSRIQRRKIKIAKALLVCIYIALMPSFMYTIMNTESISQQQNFVQYSNDAMTMTFDQYTSLCNEYSYSDLMNSPNQYIGKKAVFSGKIMQVQEHGNYIILFLDVENAKGLWVNYYRYNANEQKISEGDNIKVWGELDELKTFTSTLGTQDTVPQLNMIWWKII